MEYKIRKSIASQIKESYAIEGEEAFQNIEIDCAEGINIVSFSEVAKEAFEAIDYTIMKDYPHSMAVKKAVQAFWNKYDANLEDENIITCDGSIWALYLINKLFIEVGDKVLGLAPQFPEYGMDVAMCGGEFITYDLKPENNYKFDADEFIDLITEDLKLIYIDNPNNPTGQIIPLADIKKIVEAAEKKNVVIIVDEAYGDYMEAENSAVTIAAKYPNLIAVKTFSKGYGLAGLRGGYIVESKGITKFMKNINTPYEMSSVTRAVASKVIADYDFLVATREANKRMKSQLIKDYKNLSIAYTSDTVSIMMVTHKNKDIDLEKEFAKLKIAVVSAAPFKTMDKNSVRFRFPAEKHVPQLIEAFEIIDNIE